MHKSLFFILLINFTTVFSMEVNLTGLTTQFNRQDVFVIAEYLRACCNGNSKKASALLQSKKASQLFSLGQKNETGSRSKRQMHLAEIRDVNGCSGLMLAAAGSHEKTVAAILPFHSAKRIRMQDNVKGYDAETWAQWDAGSDACLKLIQQRLQELGSSN